MTPEQLTEATYIGFVGSKAKPGYQIQTSLTPAKCHLLHMAIGIAGEAFELQHHVSPGNLKEECGDLEFYIAGMRLNRNDLGINTDSSRVLEIHIPNGTTGQSLNTIQWISQNILERVKKHVMYNKELDTAIVTAFLRDLNNHLLNVYRNEDLTRAEVLEDNKAKLEKRYEKGYSDKAAQERADKKDEES